MERKYFFRESIDIEQMEKCDRVIIGCEQQGNMAKKVAELAEFLGKPVSWESKMNGMVGNEIYF